MLRRLPMSRTKPQSDIETAVLLESRRRCCLCVYLDGDWTEKQVQIAHVDRVPSNSNYEDLAVLCLSHHDRYDSRHSQSKGYTPAELRAYRARLVEALRSWAETPQAVVDAPIIRAVLHQENEDRDDSVLASGAVWSDDPTRVLAVRTGEKSGNELLRLARETGWIRGYRRLPILP
jgi:hypothetical protein